MSKPKISGRAPHAKRFKLAELRRELNYSEFNKRRAEKEWKQICLNVSLPKLREEMINCWHYFERIVDTKDFVISLCMDDMKKLDEQYTINLQSHQNNLDNLMNGLSRKLQDIHMWNNELLMNLIRKSLEDWESEIHRTNVSENQLKVMRFGLEVLRKRWDKMSKTENFARRNEESTKVTHDIIEISFTLELKLEDLWNRMRITNEDYLQHVQENKKHHDVIQEIDEVNNRIVHKELKKLINLQVLSKRLASKFKELVRSLGKKQEYLENERDSLHELQFALRNKLMQDKDNDGLKRTIMSIEFIQVYESLNAKLKKGESIMKVLKGMRRYEICHQKILPYPFRSCDQEQNDEFFVPELRLFWQRVAEADAYRYTLNEERTYLKAENKKLRKQIHSYCECLKCPSLPQIPQRAGKIPYTEGREMLKKQKAHLNRRK